MKEARIEVCGVKLILCWQSRGNRIAQDCSGRESNSKAVVTNIVSMTPQYMYHRRGDIAILIAFGLFLFINLWEKLHKTIFGDEKSNTWNCYFYIHINDK